MSAFLSSWPLAWAQAGAANAANAATNNPLAPLARYSPQMIYAVLWLFLASDPSVGARDSLVAGILTWIKAISLICLVCWVVSWLIVGVKERLIAQGHWFDLLGLAGFALTPAAVVLKVLEDAKRIPPYRIGGYSLTMIAAVVCVIFLAAWAEIATARTIRRVGRRSDALVQVAIHVALALGIAAGLYLYQSGLIYLVVQPDARGHVPRVSWLEGLVFGLRFGVTYMGFVVLSRVAWELFREIFLIRGRRLYSIARLSIYESNRRMWAPWVVVTVFLLVLAFTHWFLQPPRAAEMGRLYVGTLSLLCSILLTVMVTIMTPLSLPTDIQQQTIYTVVSKPVRRIELIWGRMLGYMAIVTLLVLAFGGISLAYLWRTVGGRLEAIYLQADKVKEYDLRLMPPGTSSADIPEKGKKQVIVADVGGELHFRIFDYDRNQAVDTDEKKLAEKAPQIESLKKDLKGLWPPRVLGENEKARLLNAVTSIVGYARNDVNISEFKQLSEQADQLRARMQARVPIKGSLSFLDSRGAPHAVGIDVGNDQSMREPRSHIEGATPSLAIWSFGKSVPDPFAPPGRPNPLDRQIPLRDFILPGTVEAELDRVYNLDAQIRAARAEKALPNVSATRVSQLEAAISRNTDELKRARGDYEALLKRVEDLKARAGSLAASGNKSGADAARSELASLSSPPIKVEMTFNVYRTTKGKIGDPVYAEIEAINPQTHRKYEGDVFPIKEYYTNSVLLPAWILAGSDGSLQVQIRCLTQSQYLGMAESDLYLLSSSGNFGFNYMKGLFGVWLQAMVLTAIGVFAGTFLSWPVALLMTIFFFIAGQLAFAFLVDISRQAVLGGGPFESLIRIIAHDNQMSDLTPTAGVVLAKTLDSLATPVMSMLVYLVPNFGALDVSNSVADGFMVSWRVIITNTLLAIGYALPFSFAGYLILKNREVAA
jgi:hypothetical protein